MSQTHQDASSARGQPATRDHATQHQACCVQTALNISNMYYHTLAQLQHTNSLLQTTHNELRHAQVQINTTQEELERERGTNEIINQHFLELQQCHAKLKADYECEKELRENLSQSLKASQALTEETAHRAEGLINSLRAKLTGGEVTEVPNGQSVSGLILESAKNALLVTAMSNAYSEEDYVSKLKYVMDQNIEFQHRNAELIEQVEGLKLSNEELSKQVQGSNNEIANLNKALELTESDGRRKRSRRGKAGKRSNNTQSL